MACDLPNMMRVHRIKGFINLNLREFKQALKEFHDLRDIATEADRDRVLLDAYHLIGMTY